MMYNANHTSTEWGNYQLGVSVADSPLGFQNGSKYSYPVVKSNQIDLEDNNLDVLRYYDNGYFPQFAYCEFSQEIIGLKNLLMIVGGKEVCLVFQA